MAVFHCTSDTRTVNNTERHMYRVLTDAEKAQVLAIKDKGAEFLELLDGLVDATSQGVPSYPRCLLNAHERVEEAVMWAVKHITT